jgi:hypothetical protein
MSLAGSIDFCIAAIGPGDSEELVRGVRHLPTLLQKQRFQPTKPFFGHATGSAAVECFRGFA